jgi:hypothetical protein
LLPFFKSALISGVYVFGIFVSNNLAAPEKIFLKNLFMLLNYLKIGLRNLLRHKVFSLINICGLALGMTCAILIMLWAKDELSFNKFHKESHLLYRVMEEQHYPGGEDLTTDSNPSQLQDALKKGFPEITHAAKTTWEMHQLFAYDGKVLKETGRFVGNDFLQMFTFPLLKGDPKTALSEPRSVVISEKMANKYFGTTEDVVGKIFKVNNEYSYRVTGIAKDVPANSTIKFEFLMPVKDFEAMPGNEWLQSWGNNGLRTFIKLRPDADVAALNKKIKYLIKQHLPESETELFLQAVDDMYLRSDFRQGKSGGGKIEYVRLFSIVAVFILVIACINFMNLATARSAKRAKEVGVRKVIGATRSNLIGQFLGESVLVALLACVLSVNLAQAILPSFNEMLHKQIQIDYSDPVFICLVLGIALFTGILSGSYPAFFLSSFKPVSVLKGTIKFSNNVALFRKGLVVFQFILSAVFIISTLVIYKQIHFIKNKNIGLDRENVMFIPLDGALKTNFQAFRRDLLQNPDIISVTTADVNPLQIGNSTGGIEWDGKDPKANVLFSVMRSDYDFLKTLNIKLKDGRDFSRQFSTDSMNYLVNEEAARLMNMKNPVGQKIKWDTTGHIIGVIHNFHSSSMHNSMQPLIIALQPRNTYFALVRVISGNAGLIANLTYLDSKYNPLYAF